MSRDDVIVVQGRGEWGRGEIIRNTSFVALQLPALSLNVWAMVVITNLVLVTCVWSVALLVYISNGALKPFMPFTVGQA